VQKGLLIDFWGTLFYPVVTIEEYHRLRSLKVAEALASNGYEFDVEDVYRAYIEARLLADEIRNNTFREVDLQGEIIIFLNKLNVKPNRELLKSLSEAYMYPYLNSMTMALGAPELLIHAKSLGYKVIIASNTFSGEHTLKLLKHKGLSTLFDAFAFSDEIAYRKPHPRFYSWIVYNTGIIPTKSIFVGDEEADIIGAKNLGMKTVAYTGFHEYNGREKPDYTVKDMSEIKLLLETV
jgi:putative hydrolase of the HAD superfamily